MTEKETTTLKKLSETALKQIIDKKNVEIAVG